MTTINLNLTKHEAGLIQLLLSAERAGLRRLRRMRLETELDEDDLDTIETVLHKLEICGTMTFGGANEKQNG